MIKELILTSLLQSADVASTNYALKNPNNFEANWLMKNNRMYATSAICAAGTAYGLKSIKNKKTRIIVGAAYAGLRIAIIANNINKGKR